MRWPVIIWLVLAAFSILTDDYAEAQVYILFAILFVLMEIADNTKAGKRNL